MQLPEKIWKILNLSWGQHSFYFLGVLNIYVAFNYSIDTWASFKLFGTTGLMFVFIILQTLLSCNQTHRQRKCQGRYKIMWYAIMAEDVADSPG